MNNNPKITVLISVHNGEKYLKEAVDSILNQDYKDFEFLIIDDASTDNTSKILNNYSDPRIKIIKNITNLGLTKSLNIGIREARGEYIARMDADDISLSERLQIQIDFMDANKDIILTGSWAQLIDQNGKNLSIAKVTDDINIIKYSFILGKPPFIHSSWMFRKEIIKDLGGYNESYKNAQDFELLSRLILNNKITNIQKELVKLRIHPESITANIQNKDYSNMNALKVFIININNYTNITQQDFINLYKSKTVGAVKITEMLKSLYTLKCIHTGFIKKEHINNKDINNTYKSIKKTIVLKYFKNLIK